MATLDLPTDPRTAVWRLIVARLQADPALAGAIRTWLVWSGASADNAALTDVRPPALRLYPLLGPEAWYDAAAQAAPLLVSIEAAIPGTDAEDILNLQGAIEDALYPPGDEGTAWRLALVDAGAETGLITFPHPITQPVAHIGAGGLFLPIGTFRVDVLRRLIR